MTKDNYSSIPAAIAAIGAGEMVIVQDDPIARTRAIW